MIKKFKKGLGLIELMITVSIISVAMFAFAQAAIVFLRAANISSQPQIAAQLAQEGIEAVRSLRNESWSTNIASLTVDTKYYPIINSSSWQLDTVDPGPLQGKFTRFVKFSSVQRDFNDDIVSSGGTVDADTLQVKVTIQWTDEREQVRNFDLITYLTNFLDN